MHAQKIRQRTYKKLGSALLSSFVIAFAAIIGLAAPVFGYTYSSGLYGACQYQTCDLTLSSSGSVSMSMQKTTAASTMCSVGSDSVGVMTHSSTGWTLSISTDSTDTALHGGTSGGTIPASTATAASPSALTATSWGYRVDSGTFGAGPTSAQSGGPSPSVSFAGVPANTSPSFVTSSNSPADPTVVTPVWFGVCTDMNIAEDTYTGTVVYSATLN